MPDFDIINKSLKAAWAKRLSAPECAMWKSLPLECLRDVGGEFIFYCNFSLKTLPYLSSSVVLQRCTVSVDTNYRLKIRVD